MVSNIGASLQVSTNLFFDHFWPKQAGVLPRTLHQNIPHERAQAPAQPIMCRNVKSDFLAAKNSIGKLAAHQFLQKNFLPRTANLQGCGQRRGEFNDAVIEKWRAHLERMRHAHAIGFVQNIVGKKLFLIEPQKWRQIVGDPEAITQFVQDVIQSGRKRHA